MKNFQFELSNVPIANRIIIKPVHTIDSDFLNVCLYIYPPLLRAEVILKVVALGGAVLLCVPILGTTIPPTHVTLLKGELEYELYRTHQLSTGNDGQTIDCIYVRIDTVAKSVCTNENQSILMERTNGRCRFLNWFPPDIDPASFGLSIDSRLIPQRTPLWYKLRGDVSGSKAALLLGWFVPHPAQGPWSYDKQPPFTAFQKSIMHLGTVSEDVILLSYLMYYTKRVYHETGWINHPTRKGWGCSPDGIVDDLEGPSRGVLEMKTSKFKSCFENYYIPQLYMEMMTVDVQWADLCRYHVGTKQVHVYRINREVHLENTLVRLWIKAYANRHRLQELVHTDPEYVSFRFNEYNLATTVIPIVDNIK